MKEEISKAIEQARKDFESVRATIVEKATVVGSDVKETVEGHLKTVEDSLNQARDDIERGTDEARLQATLAAMEARDRWQAIETELVDHVQKVKANAEVKFDKLRMQAEVDKVTAEAAVAARKEEAQRWFAQSVEAGEKALNDVAAKLKSTVSQALDRLKSL